jgi:hypothetical protein
VHAGGQGTVRQAREISVPKCEGCPDASVRSRDVLRIDALMFSGMLLSFFQPTKASSLEQPKKTRRRESGKKDH